MLLLVASETGHVYTFATRKLQPMITSETGKALIQTCLNSPDSPRSDSAADQRMSATGFEETDITYQVTESDGSTEEKVTVNNDHDNNSSNKHYILLLKVCRHLNIIPKFGPFLTFKVQNSLECFCML